MNLALTPLIAHAGRFGRLTPLLAATACAASLGAVSASAQAPTATLTVLDSFYRGINGGEGADGSNDKGHLIQGSDGNFYGTASSGGSNNLGDVFEFTPAGVLEVLYSFTSYTASAYPSAGLVQGPDGNFYGTSVGGGANYTGTVFELTPAGIFSTLYTFSAQSSQAPYGNADGADPEGGLTLGSDGNFYGTTVSGGANANGTIFQMTPAGVLNTLYSFSATDGSAVNPYNPETSYYYNVDGDYPSGPLVEGSDGNFYGTAQVGGANGTGTIFRVTPTGEYTVLHTFNANLLTGASNTDGGEPMGSLVQGADGNFYGTTSFGGVNGGGTFFQITPGGVLTTLYSFAGATYNSEGDEVNAGGAYPNASLILGNDGNFYGTTGSGGPGGNGTIFQVTPAGVLTSLYAFSATSTQAPYGNADGVVPSGGLTLGSAGNFYGTTVSGGTSGAGTIFKLTVTDHPAFFTGQSALDDGVYYLTLPNGNLFGYYSYLTDPSYIYHFDLGYEYVFDADDGLNGVYLYDFTGSGFFYTSPAFPFPYLYDFNLNSVVYYYPDTSNPGHYTTNPRSFYDFATGEIISK